MARWNSNKRVLEHEHSRYWQYRLLDVPTLDAGSSAIYDKVIVPQRGEKHVL